MKLNFRTLPKKIRTPSDAATVFSLFCVLILLIFVMAIYLDRINFVGTGTEEPTVFISSLMKVVAGIFAITISLIFIAMQLIAHLYTPRLFDFVIRRIYFIVLIFANITTLLYSSYLLGCVDNPTPWMQNLLLLLFVFDLLFLAPCFYFVSRDLHPASSGLVRSLCKRISLEKIAEEIKEENNGEEHNLFEPINEIVMTAIIRYDLGTINKCIREIAQLYLNLLAHKINKCIQETAHKYTSQKPVAPRAQGDVLLSLYFKKNALEIYINQMLKTKNEGILKQIIRTLRQVIWKSLEENKQVLEDINNKNRNKIMEIMEKEFVHLIDILDYSIKCAEKENLESVLKVGILTLHQVEFAVGECALRNLETYIRTKTQQNSRY